MEREESKSESPHHTTGFYEGAINNYSIIVRIINNIQDGLLVTHIPGIIVEESFFDVCKIMVDNNGVIHQGFCGVDNALSDLDFVGISMLNGGASTPSLVDNAFGYGTLYLHPIKNDLRVTGYILLGKRHHMDIGMKLLRELEMLCDICSKSLLLNNNNHSEPHTRTALEIALEEFPDAFLLLDIKGIVCYANKKAKSTFEKKRGLLVGELFENVVPGVAHDFTKEEGILYGEVYYKSGNAYKIFRIESFPVKEVPQKGEWIGVILKDVIGNKITEEEYLLRQRTESIGMLAGGIGHDFNNILTGILGYASLLKKSLSDDTKLNHYAEAIEHSAQRASKQTQHLLNFSRRQKKSTGVVNINELLEDVLFFLEEGFSEINIEKDLETSLPSINGDEAGLQNVFLNLLINAKDAMNGKGLLRISTKRDKHIEDKQFIVVEIEDTGSGIDEELKSKVYEPYFSTKDSGSNLGMGLYLIDRVIKDHGGFIECESEKDKGTIFRLYIPAPSGALSNIDIEEKTLKSDILKNKSVLIVDDEPMIREFVRGVLADTGVEIFEAADGNEALTIFKRDGDNIDVVILDMIMPGLKGDKVLKELRAMRKDIKVIIASGFMSEELRENMRKFTVEAFLDKPFTDETMSRTLIEVLSR